MTTASYFPIDTATACRIAGLEPQRFNELVSGNIYTAAPPTVKGKKRMFSEADAIALFLYAHFRDQGIATATAAAWASIVQAAIAGAALLGEDDRQIAFQIGIDGSITVGRATPTAPTFFGVTVALANLRTIVREKVADLVRRGKVDADPSVTAADHG